MKRACLIIVLIITSLSICSFKNYQTTTYLVLQSEGVSEKNIDGIETQLKHIGGVFYIGLNERAGIFYLELTPMNDEDSKERLGLIYKSFGSLVVHEKTVTNLEKVKAEYPITRK